MGKRREGREASCKVEEANGALLYEEKA